MNGQDTFIQSFHLDQIMWLALVKWEQRSEGLHNLSLSDPYKVYLDYIILVACLHYESIWASFILIWELASYLVKVLFTICEKYRVLRVLEFAPNFLLYAKSLGLF